jgi:hypothetical protein|tara:strand:- start:1094 stop:1264 length:171 start_codon:yes stop_codon:yes gene_type:complete
MSTFARTVRLPTVAVVFPVIATLLAEHETACVHPNVTISELLVDAALVILADIDRR